MKTILSPFSVVNFSIFTIYPVVDFQSNVNNWISVQELKTVRLPYLEGKK